VTPVSPSFAHAWARVPASAAVRRARRISVVGLSVLVDGFGLNGQGEALTRPSVAA
jgi:hypothetical protein